MQVLGNPSFIGQIEKGGPLGIPDNLATCRQGIADWRETCEETIGPFSHYKIELLSKKTQKYNHFWSLN